MAKTKNQKVTTEDVAAELVRCCGNVSEAAKALDVHRTTVSNIIRNNEDLQRIRDDARDELVDLAETAIRQRIQRAIDEPEAKGATAEIIFTLKCLGKDRGWIEQPQKQKALSARNLTINLVEGANTPALPEEVETIIDHVSKSG